METSSRGAPSESPLPKGVREVVGRRLSPSLSPDRQCSAGARLGHRGSDRLRRRRSPSRTSSEDAVLDALDEATAASLLRETSSGAYEFVHPLVRSTIYTNLGSARTASAPPAYRRGPLAASRAAIRYLSPTTLIRAERRSTRGSSSNWRRPASEAHAAPWRSTRAVSYLGRALDALSRRSGLRQALCGSADVSCSSPWATAERLGRRCRPHRDTLLAGRTTRAGPRSKATCWHAPFWPTIAASRARSARSTREQLEVRRGRAGGRRTLATPPSGALALGDGARNHLGRPRTPSTESSGRGGGNRPRRLGDECLSVRTHGPPLTSPDQCRTRFRCDRGDSLP